MILVLMLLATGITLNLLRTVRPAGARRAGRPDGGLRDRRACSLRRHAMRGPFLGAALGTALLLPPIGSLLVFAALGLGLAIPFVAVAFIPALRSRLPKPGPWMERLQRFLAIPMGATAVAACGCCGASEVRSAGNWAGCGGGPGRLPDRLGPVAAQGPAIRLLGGDGRSRSRRACGLGNSQSARRSANGRRRRGAVERGGGCAIRCVRVIRCSSISPPTGA